MSGNTGRDLEVLTIPEKHGNVKEGSFFSGDDYALCANTAFFQEKLVWLWDGCH